MENNTTLETTEKENLFQQAANKMVTKSADAHDASLFLIDNGIDETEANDFVNNFQNEMVAAKKAQANKDMLWGAVWCVGGIVVTAVTYSNASSGGGRYMVAWGAIIFGGYQFFKGVYNSSQAN